MFYDEEWPDGPETFVGDCERCGAVKPLRRVSDPFAAEGISDAPAEEVHHWCRPCWELRCEDV